MDTKNATLFYDWGTITENHMSKVIKRVPKPSGTPIEELIEKHNGTTNPVTRSVYRDIIKNRLIHANNIGLMQ